MPAINARSIAVDGIGFGARAVSIIGFRWFDISIEPPQPPTIDVSGGGTGYTPPTFFVISIYLKDRTIKKRFEVSNPATVVAVFAKIKSIIEITVSFKDKVVKSLKPKAKLNKVESLFHKIEVKQKTPEITVRRIK